MIADSHAHAFPPMGGPSGHRSTREHMRFVQHLLRFHHQPVRRVDGGGTITEQTLWGGRDPSMEGLTDVDFRGGGYGKFRWTTGGVDYTTQYLPSTLATLNAPPELMVAQMDYVGVDKAVLHTGHAYGRLNRYLSEAVRSFPDRFWGLAMVDEWRIDEAGQARVLDRAIGEMGLRALWFQTSNLRQHGRTDTVDDPLFAPFWDHVRDMGIPVFWYVTAVEPGPEPYLAELAAFGRWLDRYPDVPVIFTHGHPLSRFMVDGKVSLSEEAWRPLIAPNVSVEVLIPIFQGPVWEYPYVEARPIIQEYYERVGPDRLAWASDMPNVERHCTYGQSLDYLRLYCDFIPAGDMAKICGDNLARLFGE